VDTLKALREIKARKGFLVIDKTLMREHRRTIGIVVGHGVDDSAPSSS
jgi:hypothetical protein